MPHLPSQLYSFHRAFNDFDELTEAARAWSLEFSQLDRGQFSGELVQIGNEQFNLTTARFNRHLFQKGVPPEGLRTFALPADNGQQFIWRRKKVRGEHVMSFPEGGELDAVSQPGFQVFTLSFSEDILAEVRESLEWSTSSERLMKNEISTFHPVALHHIRQWLLDFFKGVTQDAINRNNTFSQDILQHELPRQFFKGVVSQQVIAPPSPLLRQKALKRVEDYLNAFPATPHTVRELCRVARTSERTLEYAFLERFGVSPKTYLQAFRLNGVRKALRVADPSFESVTTVATRWGFWHMGQFARDYKRLFDELPSVTLKK